MKTLYYGTLGWGTTTLQRLEALREFFDHVYAVDSRMVVGDYTSRGHWTRIQLRLGRGPLIRRISAQLTREAVRYRPDLVWIDQGTGVSVAALSEVRRQTGALCVHYTPDSITAPGFRNALFRRALPEYDVCITTKSHEVDLYRQLGARRVLFVSKGFDPNIHRPVELDAADREKYGCDVAFIGQRMADRAKYLSALADAVPCRLHLYGRQWEIGPSGRLLGPLQKGWILGDEYAKAICGAKICLGFLNCEVGDRYTQRTIEIPACGGFMLAQRTEEQRQLFQEDQEAVYFDSEAELIDKVKFYLIHDELRERIARAGHHRAVTCDYSWRGRMRECAEACDKLISEASPPGGTER